MHEVSLPRITPGSTINNNMHQPWKQRLFFLYQKSTSNVTLISFKILFPISCLHKHETCKLRSSTGTFKNQHMQEGWPPRNTSLQGCQPHSFFYLSLSSQKPDFTFTKQSYLIIFNLQFSFPGSYGTLAEKEEDQPPLFAHTLSLFWSRKLISNESDVYFPFLFF